MTSISDPLLPYQIEGAKWLTERRLRLLCDEMGVGKSAQCVRACDEIEAKKILIICPAIVRPNWVNEFRLWSKIPREFQVIEKLKDPIKSSCLVVSYDYAAKQSEKLGDGWDVVICDEAHFLKSTTAGRAKAILGKQGLIHRTKRFWALTGTPAPNNYSELWVFLYTFGATKLGFEAFTRRFCHVIPSTHGMKIVGGRKENLPELKELLKSISLRRTKESVNMQLPPLTLESLIVEPGHVDVEIQRDFAEYMDPEMGAETLSSVIKKQNDMLEYTFNLAVDSPVTAKERLAVMEGLASSVSVLRRFLGLKKVEPVCEIVAKELENKAYAKIILFAIHRDVINELKRRLSPFGVAVIHGGTAPASRTSAIKRFSEDPKVQVLIANIQTAGTGINLTAAHNVIFVEQEWVPGHNAQAVMRCHRRGQTEPTLARFVSVANSFDVRVGEILRRKTADLTALYDL